MFKRTLKSVSYLLIIQIFLMKMVFAGYPVGSQASFVYENESVNSKYLYRIGNVIQKSIEKKYYPGAVILVGYENKIIYQGIFGNQSLYPQVLPMKATTIFDIASLTKVVATTPAVMQLVEQGKLNLDAPVTTYWPEFGRYDKKSITVRQLLTHTSGLPAVLPKAAAEYEWQGKSIALSQIRDLEIKIKPGSKYIYSDLNFIVLGFLVEKISGQSLDQYVSDNVFKKLGMQHTFYLPSEDLKNDIAPTEIIKGELIQGRVHDPLAFAIGGVAGNAGLFSTAQDLAIYASYLLTLGKNAKETILKPETIELMTQNQLATETKAQRGLGFNIDPFDMKIKSSYGHTGWTGTSLWVEPNKKVWVVFLTSRTHPNPTPKNQVIKDRAIIADLAVKSIKP